MCIIYYFCIINSDFDIKISFKKYAKYFFNENPEFIIFALSQLILWHKNIF